MARVLPYIALAALLAATGCASRDTRPYDRVEPVRQPVIQPQPVSTLEGQVVRSDTDSVVIREASGRESRVFVDRNTMKDNINVGDWVVVQFEGPPNNAYASTITRRAPTAPIAPAAVGSVLPRPQTFEGPVLRSYWDDFTIRDISGKEVHLRVDDTTNRDSNVTVGDRVMAVVSEYPPDSTYPATLGPDGNYYTNVYRSGSPGIYQGDIVRIDGNRYLLRDSNTGRDIPLYVDSATRRDGVFSSGDRVVAFTDSAARDAGTPHVARIYRAGNPNLIQGDVMRADGDCWMVRDTATGRDFCLNRNAGTVWHDNINAGDRIIAYKDPSSNMHVDFLAKR